MSLLNELLKAVHLISSHTCSYKGRHRNDQSKDQVKYYTSKYVQNPPR